MKLGPKLAILLLAIGLVPLVLVAWQGHQSLKGLGDVLGERSRTLLEGRVTDEVRRATEHAAIIIEQQSRLLELALRFQASEAAKRLAAPVAPPLPAPGALDGFVFAEELDTGPDAPQRIDLDAQSILLMPNTDDGTADDVLRRMAAMTATYKALYARHRDLVLWQYVSLEAGVHSSYPGHGDYPDGYDPRERTWYVDTAEAGALKWHPLYFDASTGFPIVTVSMPVTLPNGDFAGVAAIDVRARDILRNVQRQARLPADGAALVVMVTPDTPAPNIVARLFGPTGDWQTASNLGQLDLGDGATARAALKDFTLGAPGVRRLAFEGRDVLMAYSPISLGAAGQSFLITVMPYARITEEAAKAEAAVDASTAEQLSWTALFMLIMIAGVAPLAILSARSVTRPVAALADAAGRVAAGDFQARAPLGRGDELGDLARAFNGMVPRLEDQVAMKRSLALAREVQQHLIPKTPPLLDGFDIAGRAFYCDETGGDYLDYITDMGGDPSKLGVALGDVTGHGVPAALLMTTGRALVRGAATETDDLGRLATRANAELARDIQGGRFMTLFVALLDRDSRDLAWVSAGHEPALLYDTETDDFRELGEGGIPLGVDAGWTFETHSLDDALRPGRILIAATDGVRETRDGADAMFGRERLEAIIRDNAGATADGICAALASALDRFRAGAPVIDDATFIIIKGV